MKDIVVREAFRAQIRGEFFNAVNQVNCDLPISIEGDLVIWQAFNARKHL